MAEELPELERAKRLIRKLSERTTDRGCTEAEAMESAEKVGALLQQFDLTLSEVFIAEEICVQREFYAANDHFGGVVAGICRFCSLRHYRDINQQGCVFVVFGFQRDMELAEYLYEVITEAFSTEWAVFTKDHGFARKTRESFEMGYAARIHQRLVSMRSERDEAAAARAAASNSKDLVLVRDAIVDEEFRKTGVRLISGKAPSIRDGHAYRRGAEAARKVALNTPVNGETRSSLEA